MPLNSNEPAHVLAIYLVDGKNDNFFQLNKSRKGTSNSECGILS